MSSITPVDVREAQALYTQLSKAPLPAAALKQAAAGNPHAEQQVDLFVQLSAHVRSASQIDAPVLVKALKAAGLGIEQMRGKMGSCPVGGRPSPALPRD